MSLGTAKYPLLFSSIFTGSSYLTASSTNLGKWDPFQAPGQERALSCLPPPHHASLSQSSPLPLAPCMVLEAPSCLWVSFFPSSIKGTVHDWAKRGSWNSRRHKKQSLLSRSLGSYVRDWAYLSSCRLYSLTLRTEDDWCGSPAPWEHPRGPAVALCWGFPYFLTHLQHFCPGFFCWAGLGPLPEPCLVIFAVFHFIAMAFALVS